MSKKLKKLEGLQDTFKEHDISADTIELSDALIKQIKKVADSVPDY